MNRILLLIICIFFASNLVNAQCTPINCSVGLPPFGGLCDSILIDGSVNTPYSDNESFIISGTCFDAGLVDPSQAGLAVRTVNVDMFNFSGMPAGLTGSPNAPSYQPPVDGVLPACVFFQGTPTEAGMFVVVVDFLGDVNAYIFGGGSCTGFAAPNNDNVIDYELYLLIKPDASFSGLNSFYCVSDPSTFLTPMTAGGSFSGPGMFGASFNPATAGVGTHTITHILSLQQGAAVGPAADTVTQTVTVGSAVSYYRDADNDGYGDATDVMMACGALAGYVLNNTDCDDTNMAVNPAATEVCNFVDDNCNMVVDEGEANLSPVLYVVPSSVQGISNVSVAVRISEVDNFDTDGSTIRVNLPSDTRLTFTYDPTLTLVALQAVDNSQWTYLGNSGVFHQFEFTGPLSSLSNASFGFNGVYDPEGTDGQTTITVAVIPFSGGECYINNNVDAELLEYFD